MLKGQIVQKIRKRFVNFFALISVCHLCSIFQVNQDTTCDIKFILHNLWFTIYWFMIYWVYRDALCIEWIIKLLTILQRTIFFPTNTLSTLMLMISLLDTLYIYKKAHNTHLLINILTIFSKIFLLGINFFIFYPSEHVWYLCSSL